MKSKSLTYFLIAGVMAIWGIVFYRLYTSVSTNEDTSTNDFKLQKNVMKKDASTDSFQLVANYRDPFLGTLVLIQNKVLTRKKKYYSKSSGNCN